MKIGDEGLGIKKLTGFYDVLLIGPWDADLL